MPVRFRLGAPDTVGLGSPHPAPRLAPVLFKQFNGINHHATIDGFQHVIDGEQANGGSGEGFHFDAGASDGFGI